MDLRDVALRGWHDVGGECSVAPQECTEIRRCVTHALAGAPLRGAPGVVRWLPYACLSSDRLCTVYAHVTPPHDTPLGCRGERPHLAAPFSTELAGDLGTINLATYGFFVSTLT